MAKQRKKVITNVSRDQAEDAMAQFADAANTMQKIEAEMNKKMAAIRESYQDQVNELNETKEEQFAVLEVYANEQNENWGKKKSLELLHGTIGFRTGTPKIKFEKGFNGKSVTAILKEHFPEYVRTVDEMNKELLIANREDEGFSALCKKAHIEVVQDETFYAESKSEELQEA